MHMYWSFYRIKRVFPYNFSFLVVPDSCDYWSYLRVMHFGSGPINYNHLNKPKAVILYENISTLNIYLNMLSRTNL